MEARESNCLDAGQVRNARGAISNSRDEVLSSDESLPHSSAASVIDGAAEAASISAQKDELIALVSVSSVMEAGWSFKKGEHSVLFGDPRDLRRMAELVHSVSADDGEFVLKLALYARRDLCLHRTAALLVSFCAYEWRCQPFLKCYMKHIVLLPSDWLSVANVALQVSHFQLPPSRSVVASVSSATGEEAEFKREKCDGGFKSLPNALQLALASIFTTFDEFSLSEYNTERCVKRARRKQGRHTRSTSPTGAELNRQGYANGPFSSHPRERTFKDLVRHLHISEPIYVVYCLLGRRYPSNREIFLRRKMDDGGRRDFDPSLSGKRMRLPVPETWERAISRDGNRGAVWDGLVASNRLPLTAALCNVRNVILSGSSRETHASLVNRFTSEEDIFASQQLPGRFVAAHDRLCISARSALSRFYALVDRDRTLSTSKSSDSNNSCNTPPSVTEVEDLCCKYKSALQLVSITREMMLEEGFEGRKLIDDACLLALEFKYAFESCTILFLCYGDCHMVDAYVSRGNKMWDNLERLRSVCRDMWNAWSARNEEHKPSCANSARFPYAFLDRFIEDRTIIQALVVMDYEHSCYAGQNSVPSLGDLPVYLERIRRVCNEDFLFVALKASRRADCCSDVRQRYQHPKDFLLCGFSEAVLRVVAEATSGRSRCYIEQIDEAYDVNRAVVGMTHSKLGNSLHVRREAPASETVHQAEESNCREGKLSIECLRDALEYRGQREDDGVRARRKRETTLIEPLPSHRTLSAYRQIRFFLSSTFLDMENERNALVLDVFPRLRRWVQEAGLHVNILEVDLRWGITEDSSRSDLSTSVCLNEVSRCAPFFLGVLGSRYGYCPPTLYHEVDKDVDSADFGWLAEWQQKGNRMSITEMEVRHAIFNAKRRTHEAKPLTMAFLMRDQAALVESLPMECKKAYSPDGESSATLIQKLATHITQQHAVLLPYKATYMGSGVRSCFCAPPTAWRPATSARTGMTLTSMLSTVAPQDVLLDMTDFSRKAFAALKCVVQRYLGLPLDPDDMSWDGGIVPGLGDKRREREDRKGNRSALLEHCGSLYGRETMQQLGFTSLLLKRFVCPQGFLEKLVHFALTGRVVSHNASYDAEDTWAVHGATTGGGFPFQEDHVESNVLMLQASEGNGASTMAAAVSSFLKQMNDTNTVTIHYACQASEGNLRHLVYYLAFSLIHRLGMQNDYYVRETDAVPTLLQLLPRVYAAAVKRRNVCIILDGIDKSPYAQEILNNLGCFVVSGTDGEIRYIVTAAARNSPLATALRSRIPPAVCMTLPGLSPTERAELVRRHLASYGKRLQESFHVNELQLLLRKADASQASYLTQAVNYLRLFSSFDTLRNDIVQLPSTLTQLKLKMYEQLEERFGEQTCRDVLVSLCISHGLGGLNEFTLYRLVSNVASAMRLVVLLNGTCLRIRRRRVTISSAPFASSIAFRYIPNPSDVVDACLNLLVAQLYYRPLLTSVSRHEIRESIQFVMNTIKRDHDVGALFDPKRYTAGELLGLIYLSHRAKAYDVMVTLSSYFPFLENLIVNGLYLQRFLSMLSQATLAKAPFTHKLSQIADFLQQKYHILCHSPSHLRQCILNDSGRRSLFVGLSHDAQVPTGSPNVWVKWLNNAERREDSQLIVLPSAGPIRCFTVSPDGQFMAGCGDNMMAYIMTRGSPNQVTASLRHNSPVTAIAFSPQKANILLTGGSCGTLSLWSLEDNSLLQRSRISHRRCISSLAYHPTKNLVCSGSHDNTCAIWHVGSSAMGRGAHTDLVPSEMLNQHHAPVSCVSFHGSGDILATGSWEGYVCFINMQQRLGEFQHEYRRGNDPNIEKEGNVMDSESSGLCLPEHCETLPYEHYILRTGSPVRALTFIPSMVVTCAVGLFNGEICLYDYASASCSARLALHSSVPVVALSFSPDAKWMASADEHGTVLITYAGVTGTILCSLNGHQRAVNTVCFDPHDPLSLYTSSLDGTVRLWPIGSAIAAPERSGIVLGHTHTNNSAIAMRTTHVVAVTACAAATDGSFFVTADTNGIALVFTNDAKSASTATYSSRTINDTSCELEPQLVLLHEGHRVSYICIALRNTRILCGTANGEVFVWDTVPGLNLCDGRLLRRIRVSDYGDYPIAYIGCSQLPRKITQGKREHEEPLGLAQPTRFIALTMSGAAATWKMYEGDDRQYCEATDIEKCVAQPPLTCLNWSNSDKSESKPYGGEYHRFSSALAFHKRISNAEDIQCMERDCVLNFLGSKAAPCQPHNANDSSASVTGFLDGADGVIHRSVIRWFRERAERRIKANTSTNPMKSPQPHGRGFERLPSTDAEEVLAVISPMCLLSGGVGFSLNREKVDFTAAEVEHVVDAANFKGGFAFLDEWYVVVGRHHCYLLIAAMCAAVRLPIYDVIPLEDEFEGIEDTEGYGVNRSFTNPLFGLRKGEVFVCASNGVSACTAAGMQHSYCSVVFALATNSSSVLLIEGRRPSVPEDNNANYEQNGARYFDHHFCAQLRVTQLSLIWSTKVFDCHGRAVAVNSLALTLSANEHLTTLHKESTECDGYGGVARILLLTVGCRDGSTHFFKFCIPKGSVNGPSSPAAMNEGAKVHKEEECAWNGGECDSEARGELGSEAVHVARTLSWQKCGVFYASSSVTALTTMRCSSKLSVPSSPRFSFTGPTQGEHPASLKADAELLRTVTHIAGDCFGNIYMLQLVCEAGHGLGNRGKRSSRNSFHLLPSNYSQETTLSGRSYAFKALEPSILPALRSTPSHGTAVFNATAKEMLPDNRTEDTAAWRMEMQRIIELFQPCSAATADHSDCDGDAYVCPEDVCASKKTCPAAIYKNHKRVQFQ
uniref:Putative telomerase-associated protein n=1 Tax=Trypanosoma vivax (strain Y486) TaxID=1055687 RepID=G0TXM8_TRYVY|nr:putative telomerase-associated protein, fragment [Trypanosoma vivax Y486]